VKTLTNLPGTGIPIHDDSGSRPKSEQLTTIVYMSYKIPVLEDLMVRC